MKIRYCRYCREDVPMFDNQEKEVLDDVYRVCILKAKQHRTAQNTSLKEIPFDDLFQPFFEKYEELARQTCKFTPHEVMSRHYLARWKAYRDEV